MANTKITGLTAVGAAATEDLVELVDDPSGTPLSRKATVQQVLDSLGTTKGDLYVHNGTALVRVGVGADGGLLEAASGEASGVKWSASGAYAPASGQYAVNTVAASGATETLPATFPAHNVTMDVNCTFTFSAPTAGHTFILRLAGAFTPTFPASVVWDGGTAPTYATPSVYAFTTLDAGTTWFGSLVGSAFA